MEYSKDLINTYRKKIYDFLKDYEGEPVVIKGIPSNLLKQVLFNENPYGEGYIFNSEISKIIEKIDFRNVNFDHFHVEGMDFSKLKNVKLNPDTIDFFTDDMTIFDGVYFTKKITVSTELCNVSFNGSFNAQLNFDDSFFTWFDEDDFCDVVFRKPMDFLMNVFDCNFEGSHGAIIDLGKVDIWNTVLYDATIYGQLNPKNHREITPSINEIKKVYGDATEPTLIRRKDFN